MAARHQKEKEWKTVKKRCLLNDEEVNMAKELGISPRSLIKNIPSPSQRWKLPVKEWVRYLHFKKFGRRRLHADVTNRLHRTSVSPMRLSDGHTGRCRCRRLDAIRSSASRPALRSLCFSGWLRTAQSFQCASSLCCIHVPIKAEVDHKLPTDDGAGGAAQVHSFIGNG